jgi:predicted nucleic acid-binding protein
MSKLIIDTGVLSLHFRDDPRVERQFDEIDGGKSTGHIAGINLAEFYYKTCQKLSRQTADTWFHLVRGSPLRIASDEELNRQAGFERCKRTLDLSIADCYALALAKRLNGTLLTTDGELAKSREVEVLFFPI